MQTGRRVFALPRAMLESETMRLFSVGHGARSFEELVQTLASGAVEQVIDVRSFPGSRRHPQFGREVLAEALPGAGIIYHWQPALGGRRRLQPGASLNL